MQRVGDHAAVQHVVDRQRLAAEDRVRVGVGVEALVHGDLRQGARVVAVLRGVALGDHRVAGVLAHVAVGQVELRLRRAIGGAVAAEAHGAGHGGRVFVGAERRHALRQHAEHRLAQAQFDGRGGAPDHADRRGAAQVDHFGEVHRDAQVFGGHRRHEGRGFMEQRAVDHQAVQVAGLEAGIGQRAGRQVGDLLQVEHPRRRGVLLGLVLSGADDRRVSS
ncbi:hypothetical protein D3C76_1019640 [compost metagenome]